MKPRREKLSKADRDQVYRTYGDRCWLCGLKISYGQRSVDHVKPIRSGGTNLLSNCRPAHHLCNSRRGAPLPNAEGKYR